MYPRRASSRCMRRLRPARPRAVCSRICMEPRPWAGSRCFKGGCEQEQLLPAMDLLSVTATIDADIVVDGYLAFARLQQAVGSTEAARRTLAELIDVAHRRKVWPGLIARGETMRAHLALLQGDLAFAQEWATRTGVRIGQELPYGHFTA